MSFYSATRLSTAEAALADELIHLGFVRSWDETTGQYDCIKTPGEVQRKRQEIIDEVAMEIATGNYTAVSHYR